MATRRTGHRSSYKQYGITVGNQGGGVLHCIPHYPNWGGFQTVSHRATQVLLTLASPRPSESSSQDCLLPIGDMSYPAALDGQLTAQDQRAIFIQDCIHLLSATILYYDHLITIADEISFVWSSRSLGAKALFLVNRYFTFMVNAIVTYFSFHDVSPSSCQAYTIFRQLALIASTGFVSFLLMLRIYALCHCNRQVLFALIGTGIALSSIICWALITSRSSISTTFPGCHIADSAYTGIRTAAAWEVLLALDVLVFACTIYKAYTSGSASRSSRFRNGLLRLILRDGATYFIIMALANLGNILTFYLARPLLKGTLSTFASNISVTLMSRLMLNLYERAQDSFVGESIELSDTSGSLPAFSSHFGQQTQLLPNTSHD